MVAHRSWLLLLLATIACEQPRTEPPSAPGPSEPSPNASVLPAPLVAGPPRPPSRDVVHVAPEPSAEVGVREPPRPLREDEALAPDSELRAAPGFVLQGRFRWVEAPPPRPADAAADALARARDKSTLEVAVHLSSLGRMRLQLASDAFPLPRGSELRSRDDRLGHVLVWPAGSSYTPLPAGTLRAVLADARVDVAPLSEPSIALAGPGALLGLVTQKIRLENSIGRLELEQAVVAGAEDVGELWCRFVLELLAVAPTSPACRAELVPLRAELTWASGRRFELEVTKLTRRPELSPEGLAVPPPGALARRGELPGPPFIALVDEKELGELRVRALPPPEKVDPTAPKKGLVFQNRSDGPRYLLVDGVPVAWLRTGAEWLVSGLRPHRYTVSARDFFGAESSPPRTLQLPARYVVGDEPERGAH